MFILLGKTGLEASKNRGILKSLMIKELFVDENDNCKGVVL